MARQSSGAAACQTLDTKTVIVAEHRLPVPSATSSAQAASVLAASPSVARAAVTAPNMSTHTCTTGDAVMLTANKASG